MQKIDEYELTAITHGTASAPYLAVRTLIEIANKYPNEKLQTIIKEDFYMDDLMTGADSVQSCEYIQRNMSKHLQEFGFHLSGNGYQIITASVKTFLILEINKGKWSCKNTWTALGPIPI